MRLHAFIGENVIIMEAKATYVILTTNSTWNSN